MDSGYGRKEKKEKVDDDRLSSLSNDLIHKILSFIGVKDAVKTIALSSRYRFIWTTMPYLNFSTEDFPNLPKLSKFVTNFLTRRNTQIDVFSLKLSFRGKVKQPSVKKLMDYAFSHNIQQLDVICFFENNEIECPLSLFSSAQSLKHLSLKGFTPKRSRDDSKLYNLKASSTLELPGLTTLYLEDVTLCSEGHTQPCFGLDLSKCPNLKNLTFKRCETDGSNSFSVCHPGLSNLNLDGLTCVVSVNLVAPQLENLTIRCNNSCQPEYVISAPNLASLAYRGYYPMHLNSTDGFHSLKGVGICICHLNDTEGHQIVRLLKQLHNVEFLTLNLEIIELLSSSVELISHEPSPFINLKNLTIYPQKISEWDMRDLPKGKVSMSTEVKKYLLDSSPGATVTMFSREEIIAVKDVASAQKLMAELRVFLEQEKGTTKTKGKAPMESDNAKMHMKSQTQPDLKMQLEIGGNISLVQSCWKDLGVQFEQRKAKACLILSKLESIEGLLKKLPPTNRAMIQPCFSTLCAEADTVMCKLMKMQCDENQSRLSLCFHELATSTTMEMSS
uniref:putative FBD-associated F-box protein At5g56700 n=1 Tax=Erigeron canadensis TaxID=72917 RepID=UPI001CB9C390|nr:putative FBD-associated F-box protein At5g56700 [Erigeron canadensis]XP_043621166.1 putative FBD-associated F-box protein At5g56700 [Erigeron canadensis]